MKTQKITDKMLRQAWCEEHGRRRAYKAQILRHQRYGGGIIHCIIAGGKNNRTSTELYS